MVRYLIVLSGIPGSGKSHFVEKHQLKPYTLSPDEIRLRMRAPDLDVTGKPKIIEGRGVFEELDKLIVRRMERGEYIVLDATHTLSHYFKSYKKLAAKHRYRLVVVDFSAVPLEVCLERNSQRPEYKIVEDSVVKRFHKQIQELKIPNQIEVITPEEYKVYHTDLKVDLSQYTAIHHIGDIQGVDSAVEKYFQEYPFNPKHAYIFTGDIVDRGDRNDLAVKRFIDLLLLDNVYAVEGNHDTYLWRWSVGREVKYREFTLRTKPQLEEADIDKKKLRVALKKLRPFLHYTYHGKEVYVTHGGMAKIPGIPQLVSDYRYIHGTGKYEQVEESDTYFIENTQVKVFQIHGHRNPHRSPIRFNQRVYNLEGRVEFGGELRIVQLDASGFHPIEITTNSSQEKKEVFGENKLNIEKLRKSPYIFEKRMGATFGHISSFNFKRDVFFKKDWNDLTTIARSLFVNKDTYEIVCRGYNKFFNVEERKETRLRNLEQDMQFPLEVWVKENGYIGLVGYDSDTKKLVFASKTTTQSDYAGWLEELFYETVGSDSIDAIKKILIEENITLVFEVILPIRDPHILEYSKPKLVFLDAIHRTFEYSTLDIQKAIELLKDFGFEFKTHVLSIENPKQLSDWYAEVMVDNYTIDGKIVEGFVLEDAQGAQVKVKLPYYLFWRDMRRQMLQIYKGKTDFKHGQTNDPDLSKEFASFILNRQSKSITYKNIVRARRDFESIIDV